MSQDIEWYKSPQQIYLELPAQEQRRTEVTAYMSQCDSSSVEKGLCDGHTALHCHGTTQQQRA